MARRIPLAGDMTDIGEAATPPFVRLPEAADLFRRRADRFRQLSQPEGIGPYLALLSGIAEAQAAVAADLSVPEPEGVERALEYGMTPLDRSGYGPDATFRDIADRLFGAVAVLPKPDAAQAALHHVTSDHQGLAQRVANVLSDSLPAHEMAEHAYVAAALQVRFTLAAQALPADRIRPVAGGSCPCCGGAPVASVIVGWPEAAGARFCACSLCNTLWHHVRVKCVVCSSTEGIRYKEIEGGPGSIKAETCDKCHSYVKIMNQQKDRWLDPLADDVGSLGIDILMRGEGFARGAFNPFLLGY